MNDVARRLFAEKAEERKRAEDQLARINRGDDAGLVDISETVDGFRYGKDRLESLRQQTEAWLSQIEDDIVELERVTGCKRS